MMLVLYLAFDMLVWKPQRQAAQLANAAKTQEQKLLWTALSKQAQKLSMMQ
jgi:hypothetical protein